MPKRRSIRRPPKSSTPATTRPADREAPDREWEPALESVMQVPMVPAPQRPRRSQRKRGRPRKLMRRHKDVICALMYAGCSRAEAAEYVDCSRRTIANQLRRDPRFAEQLAKALARRELGPLCKLARDGRRSWRASAWLLQQTNPQRYGRPRQRAVSLKRVHAELEALVEDLQVAVKEGEENEPLVPA